MSCCVWMISIILLSCIGGAIGLGLPSLIPMRCSTRPDLSPGWYLTHGKPASLPVAVGGSESRGVPTGTETSTKEQQRTTASSTSRTLIAPTLAASKRAFPQEPATMLPVPVHRRAIDAHARRHKHRMVIEELD